MVSSSASSSARSAKRLGTGLPSMPRCGNAKLVAKPAAPGVHRLAEDVLHARALFLGGGALVRVVTHHEQTQRGVPDVGGEVDADAVVGDRREVLGEGREVPRDAGGERGDVHVLDVLERAGDQLVVLGARRGDREPAVARDHGGDAVEARRRERGIPEHLRVVVRVDVDEARRDDAVTGVEHPLAVEVRRRSR